MYIDGSSGYSDRMMDELHTREAASCTVLVLIHNTWALNRPNGNVSACSLLACSCGLCVVSVPAETPSPHFDLHCGSSSRQWDPVPVPGRWSGSCRQTYIHTYAPTEDN